MPLTVATQTSCRILPRDKGHPGTAAPCPTETAEVGSPALAIPLLGNGIKGKGTAIAEALLEVSSHMLPCMDLAASERQIPNHSGMQSVWKVQTRYSYTIRKQIIGAHLQKATLGRDSPIPPQWFISYNCNYLFETVQRMAFYQMCTQHPVIISTLLEVERARKKKKDYFILITKTLHRGKMIHINLQVVRGSGGNSLAFEPGGKKN